MSPTIIPPRLAQCFLSHRCGSCGGVDGTPGVGSHDVFISALCPVVVFYEGLHLPQTDTYTVCLEADYAYIFCRCV